MPFTGLLDNSFFQEVARRCCFNKKKKGVSGEMKDEKMQNYLYMFLIYCKWVVVTIVLTLCKKDFTFASYRRWYFHMLVRRHATSGMINKQFCSCYPFLCWLITSHQSLRIYLFAFLWRFHSTIFGVQDAIPLLLHTRT